jgi:hypothetical protein
MARMQTRMMNGMMPPAMAKHDERHDAPRNGQNDEQHDALCNAGRYGYDGCKSESRCVLS